MSCKIQPANTTVACYFGPLSHLLPADNNFWWRDPRHLGRHSFGFAVVALNRLSQPGRENTALRRRVGPLRSPLAIPPSRPEPLHLPNRGQPDPAGNSDRPGCCPQDTAGAASGWRVSHGRCPSALACPSSASNRQSVGPGKNDCRKLTMRSQKACIAACMAPLCAQIISCWLPGGAECRQIPRNRNSE